MAVLWSVSLDPPFFYASSSLWPVCRFRWASVSFGFKVPLTTGSPCGTSQCLLLFGSLVLSLHVSFGQGVVGSRPPFPPCLCLLGVPLVVVCFFFSSCWGCLRVLALFVMLRFPPRLVILFVALPLPRFSLGCLVFQVLESSAWVFPTIGSWVLYAL